MSQPVIELREAFWDFEGAEAAAPSRVRQTYAATGDRIDLAISTGFGGLKVASIAYQLSRLGLRNFAVFHLVCPPGIPQDSLSSEIIENSIVSGTAAVVDDIKSRPERPRDTPLIGAGESAGAGKLIIAAHQYPSLVDRLIISSPQGMNNRQLGDTPDRRRKELRHRTRATATEARVAGVTPIADYLVNGVALDEPIDPRRLMSESNAGIRYGVTREGGPEMVRVLRDRGLIECVYITPEDVVFKPAELDESIGIPGFVRRVGRGGHPSLTTVEGCQYMAEIIGLDMATPSQQSVAA